MFMLAIRSIVASKSKPWNMAGLRPGAWARSIRASASCWRTYSPAAMRKPAVPQAGSQITSFADGTIMSTIREMMCRGVRNWPLVPEVASFDSRYSYRSPLVSRSSSEIA